ncbi:hypothetical protein PMSM_13865 [Paenibacillus macquariensis subsp. macquariensis]|uniref:Uncharacterized protein n=1 Tax=Paenibacillus macquariensis TaxID=948756 RepID=A0ABY1K7M7_9BACL|nr:hypothetical protein PMSM_13865 [Paenibacillus macquariensis subsp. macquariensis]SIR37564.1 hypothetical protein SAMN05421578_11257 [Paenibacillus macquariensis]
MFIIEYFPQLIKSNKNDIFPLKVINSALKLSVLGRDSFKKQLTIETAYNLCYTLFFKSSFRVISFTYVVIM